LKVCVVGVAGVVFVVSVVGVAADRAAREALAEDGGLPAAERAARLRPDVVRYHLLVASLHADRGSVAGARDAVQAAERAANVSPGDPIVRRTLAEARTQLAAVTGDPADVAVALADWEHLVAADPHCDACRQGLGNVRLLAVELGSVGP